MSTKKKRLLAESTAVVESTPTPIDPREAAALYLLAQVRELPESDDAAARRHLKESERSLRAALKSPFAREVIRALDGDEDVSAAALAHARGLRTLV